MVAASSSAPPLWGVWHQPQESEAEQDYPTSQKFWPAPSRGQPVRYRLEADPQNRRPHRAAGDCDLPNQMPIAVTVVPPSLNRKCPVSGVVSWEAVVAGGS